MHKVPQESNIFYPHPSKRAAQFVFAAKPRILNLLQRQSFTGILQKNCFKNLGKIQ